MAHATQETFHDLEQKIKKELLRGLQFQQVTLEDVTAILTILAEAKTHDELSLLCQIFAQEFPVLKQLVTEKAHQTQENIQAKIQKAVSKLIHTNPLLAGKIAKASLTPNITWDELVTEFPELEQ